MHLAPVLWPDGQEKVFYQEVYFNEPVFDYAELRYECEDRIKNAPGLYSKARMIRLMLYVQYRASREAGYLV